MRCAACGHDDPSLAAFCRACGTRLDLPCTTCGHLNPYGSRFCGACGQALAYSAIASAPGPDESAERRQITVMFCDLVDSTALSGRLDPEDLRTIIRAYQAACVEAVELLGGYVAQYLGDGILAYFGFPVAQEDNARRSIHAGLAILRGLPQLNRRLTDERGLALAIRIGVHTGIVVVGEIGAGGRREQLALGEVPNIAARIQATAEPGTIVISAATHRLIERYFACRDLPALIVRGLSAPIDTYAVLAEVGNPATLVFGPLSTEFVGREEEIASLRSRWRQAVDGSGQVVLLHGEPGIGKSRLIHVLKERIDDTEHDYIECRCSPYHLDSAFFPVIELLQRRLEVGPPRSSDDSFARLATSFAPLSVKQPEVVPLVADLLGIPAAEGSRPPALSPQASKQRLLDAIRWLLLSMADQQPLLLVVEDLHWADPSTLELLDLIVRETPAVRVLFVLVFRPEFRSPWPAGGYVTEMSLGRLTRGQAKMLVDRMTRDRALPNAILQEIIDKTDGIPLFIEELTGMVLESTLVENLGDRNAVTGPLPPLAIPSSLQDSLMARLDRLDTVRTVVQLAAVLGREFRYDLLRTVSSLAETPLRRALDRLIEAGLLYEHGLPPDTTYVFKHALIQDAAYQSLLRSTRQQYHRATGHALQNRFPELVAAQPELLAHHYTEAGLPSDAIPWWQRAGESAIRRSANAEAINHLNRALALLGSLPDSPERRQQEIALQLTLGVPWLGQKGWGAEEVKRIYARARELCESLGQRPELAGALIGLYSFYYVRQELDTAIDLARQVLQLVENVGDPGLVIEGHWGVGLVSFSRAEFEVSRSHLEQVRTLYDPARHAGLAYVFGLDPGVTGIAYHGHTLWALGYPDAALRSAREAVELAEGVRHPLSSTLALWFAAVIHQLRGEVEEVVRVAGRALALATEQQFPIWIGCSSFLLGWAHCRVGRPDDGLRSMLEGEAIRMATGAMIYRTYFLKLLAEEYLAVGDLEAARASLAEGFDEMERSSERWCAAELHRLSGELRLRESATAVDEAESLFREAYSVARAQGAKQWALRASMGLGRLWRARGDTNSARESVGETYKTFTEGFTTADLGEARTFL